MLEAGKAQQDNARFLQNCGLIEHVYKNILILAQRKHKLYAVVY